MEDCVAAVKIIGTALLLGKEENLVFILLFLSVIKAKSNKIKRKTGKQVENLQMSSFTLTMFSENEMYIRSDY